MPEPITTPEAFADQLSYAINEIRAIGTDAEMPADRKACAARLRALADFLTTVQPGQRFYSDPPADIARSIINAATITIQV